MSVDHVNLSQLSFFEHVSGGTVRKLQEDGVLRKYCKKEILMRPKEVSHSIFIQVSGKSMVYNLTHSGKRKIIFIFGRGILLNEHVETSHEDSLYCEVLEDSLIFVIPHSRFMQAMQEDFSLTQAVLIAQELKIWRMGHQLKNTMGSIYMERKLASKLWKLARDFGLETPRGVMIDLPLSVTFLADMLGAPRETTSKVCKTLKETGLIELDGKRVYIPDKDKMSLFYKTGKIK